MNNTTKQGNEMKKSRKFEEDQFVWVTGTGFVNEVDSESRSGTVQDWNDEAVMVRFRDDSWDWFTRGQVR